MVIFMFAKCQLSNIIKFIKGKRFVEAPLILLTFK